MKKINGNYVNELKWQKITPLIEEIIYEFKKSTPSNIYEYIKLSWCKLEDLLTKENLPEETFKKLNIKYRKIIEDKILFGK